MNEDIKMGNNTGFSMTGVVPKVREPEVFHGERNALLVESWISSMELYFQLIKADHGQDQLLYALSLLRGDAQLWYSQLKVYETEKLPQDWSDFKLLLRKEFIPINAVVQARDKLASLVQNGPVSAYINEFRRLKLQIADLSQGDALDRFVRGLVKPIRVAVRSRFPATLSEAESLALAIEAAAQDAEGYAVPVQQQVQPNKANYDPMELDSLREVLNALAEQVRGGGFRGNRRRNGGFRNSGNSPNGNGVQCYGCGGTGHIKRECPTYLNKKHNKNNGSSNGVRQLKD